jgi:phospholipase A-2-activating protein
VWDVSTGALMKTLNGHEHVVWSAVGTQAGGIVSASADKRVGVWNASGQKHFAAGHTDVVRCCAILEGGMFATGSADQTICIRDPEGRVVRNLVGHEHFVFCVASATQLTSAIQEDGSFSHQLVCRGDLIASCSEDCTVRVWQQSHDFESTSFNVPQTPWSCCFMPNGDIAVGLSDSTIRVFTADESRAASAEDLAHYNAEISARQVPMEQVDVSKFPPESSLSEPGSRDGQQKIVRNSTGGADAYGWSAAHGAWQKIGEVTGRSAATKTKFEGKEYDHVLPVAMGDGAPTLQIAFNDNDDPSVVAQAFIRRYGLQSYGLQQIVDFVKNAQQPVSLAGARSSFPCGSTLPSSAALPTAAIVPKLMAKISQFNAELAVTRHLQLTPQELNGLEVHYLPGNHATVLIFHRSCF